MKLAPHIFKLFSVPYPLESPSISQLFLNVNKHDTLSAFAFAAFVCLDIWHFAIYIRLSYHLSAQTLAYRLSGCLFYHKSIHAVASTIQRIANLPICYLIRISVLIVPVAWLDFVLSFYFSSVLLVVIVTILVVVVYRAATSTLSSYHVLPLYNSIQKLSMCHTGIY